MKKIDYLILAAVIITAIVLSSYPNTITGNVTYTSSEVNTEFPVEAWGYTGWGDCSSQICTWQQVDSFCKYKGYLGAPIAAEKPCYHASVSKRWSWNGATPMIKGAYKGGGFALTKVRCEQKCTSPGERKCDGSMIIVCQTSGRWFYQESCPVACSNGYCIDPDSGTSSSEAGSTPLNVQTPQCTSHSYFKCNNNNVYWINSCGEIQELKETCTNGCTTDRCNPATTFKNTVTCTFVWPQKITIYDKTQSCPAARPYCNNAKAQTGVAQCCKYNGNYYDCQSMS